MYTKHTKLPWVADDEDIYGADSKLILRLAIECNKDGLLTEEDRANSTLIVRAVNMHDELVQALREAQTFIRQMAPGTVADRNARAVLAKLQKEPS